MKTNRLLSFILAVAMMLSVAVMPMAAELPVLSDVDATTAEGKAVNKLVSRGIINGYEDGTFRPGNSISRAEFCVVMVKFQAQQDYINPDALTGFEDLDTDENYAWARPYVAKAVELGIINGFEDKTFRAADPVTYEQAIKMLVCALGYEKEGKMPTIAGDWSSGYVAKAMSLRVTSGTSITNKTRPCTRGTVAILVANALDAERNDDTGIEGWEPGEVDEALGYEEVKGIVTGTFLTELEYADSSVPKNCIQIDDEVYEIGFSADPNNFLGCEVRAIVKEETEENDYPVVVSMEYTSKTNVLEIEADLVGDYEDGVLEYLTKRNGNSREAKIDDEYITIFNNKLYDFDITDLNDELVNGNVVLVDNNGDKRYDVIRINSYEVFVVESKNSSSQKITLMYDAEYEGDDTIVFPAESTSIIFSLKRNGKAIKFSDIAKWDVLNIKASPEDAEGKRYYEVVVTRETVSGNITERDQSDATAIVIGDEEYYIADSLMDYIEQGGEDAPKLEVGENAQVYLDAAGKIVAAAEAKNNMSSEKYAYLYALRQDSDDSEYDLEFKFFTTDGKFIQIGAASKITIDETKYKALDDDILKALERSADMANSNYKAYMDVDYTYHQPIIYQTNSDGLVSTIYTVNSTENDDISMVMEDEDGDAYYSAYEAGDMVDGDYEGRAYKSSGKTFTDFKVSSSTKIMYLPDNRHLSDDYLTFSYSKAFSNGRKYHVEAFGLTSSNTAALVLLYHQNDSRIYTSSSPWMIVASKSDTKNGTVIKGYKNGTSYSLSSVTVSEEDGPSSIANIGKGDIIRYIVDSRNELVDYQIWFDASDPSQLQPVSSNEELFVKDGEDGANRIIEVHSTSVKPRDNYPNASFRLQFGTVTDIYLNDGEDDDAVDEESITVSSVLVEDGIDDMDAFDKEDDENTVVSKSIGSSVKVFSFDRGGRNSDVQTDVDMSEILPYSEYGEDATRVIIFTASASLRMIYIIHE
ncbi:MAG: S-layer homology domain-containing protein [Clostridia bacterium]|nr:S-layer homology domain-containing protein [Clostridia bacterium]